MKNKTLFLFLFYTPICTMGLQEKPKSEEPAVVIGASEEVGNTTDKSCLKGSTKCCFNATKCCCGAACSGACCLTKCSCKRIVKPVFCCTIKCPLKLAKKMLCCCIPCC